LLLRDARRREHRPNRPPVWRPFDLNAEFLRVTAERDAAQDAALEPLPELTGLREVNPDGATHAEIYGVDLSGALPRVAREYSDLVDGHLRLRELYATPPPFARRAAGEGPAAPARPRREDRADVEQEPSPMELDSPLPSRLELSAQAHRELREMPAPVLRPAAVNADFSSPAPAPPRPSDSGGDRLPREGSARRRLEF
jgi:hypothetical protein